MVGCSESADPKVLFKIELRATVNGKIKMEAWRGLERRGVIIDVAERNGAMAAHADLSSGNGGMTKMLGVM